MVTVVKEVIIKKQCAKLNLINNSITSKDAVILAAGLKNNSTLKLLNLSGTRISDLGIQYITKALSINSNILKELRVANIGLTNKGAEGLALMVKMNKTLIHLDLHENDFSDEGLKALFVWFRDLSRKNEIRLNKAAERAGLIERTETPPLQEVWWMLNLNYFLGCTR
ncbi:unnamed protein product [Adineta ricciae]|uniref:Uncharacterized protein n=1 Tax=Adineta ricciae TaxID=249248 RepID=A0A815KYF7_ADIRI|nr:unnamed protein product [Adineta ricciae]